MNSSSALVTSVKPGVSSSKTEDLVSNSFECVGKGPGLSPGDKVVGSDNKTNKKRKLSEALRKNLARRKNNV